MKRQPIIYLLLIGLAVAGSLVWLHQTRTVRVSSVADSPRVDVPVKKPVLIPNPKPVAATPLKLSPVTVDKLGDLSPEVRSIVDESKRYADRLSAGHLAGLTNFSQPDREALYAYLLERSPADATQGGQVLKNELMDALTSVEPLPPQLGEVLVQLYQDRNRDGVIRDYAVQHLATYYEQLDGTASLSSSDRQKEQEQVRSVLWEALTETDDSIAGTALLGLNHLATESPATFDRKQIAVTALRLAQPHNAGDLTRITALQVCAELGNKQVLPVALKTIETGESVPLQISAIGALGYVGDNNVEVKMLLKHLQSAEDPRLRKPAQSSLRRINESEKRKLAAK